MRKFKRIYFVVLFLTAMILIAAKKNLATNANARFSGTPSHFLKDTIPQKSIKDT